VCTAHRDYFIDSRMHSTGYRKTQIETLLATSAIYRLRDRKINNRQINDSIMMDRPTACEAARIGHKTLSDATDDVIVIDLIIIIIIGYL